MAEMELVESLQTIIVWYNYNNRTDTYPNWVTWLLTQAINSNSIGLLLYIHEC